MTKLPVAKRRLADSPRKIGLKKKECERTGPCSDRDESELAVEIARKESDDDMDVVSTVKTVMRKLGSTDSLQALSNGEARRNRGNGVREWVH